MSRAWLEHIKAGMEGRNAGLPNCFNRFNKYLHGTRPATYYAIGGMAGAGKSGFVDDNFLLTPYFTLKNKLTSSNEKLKVKWFYFSFEVNEISKRSKWMAYLLYDRYKIKIDASKIESHDSSDRLSPEIYEKIAQLDPVLDELFEHITFIQDRENPTGIRSEILKYAEANGVTQYEEYTTSAGVVGKRRVSYTPNDPEEKVIIILDHAALMKPERGYSVKENIDKMSEYFIEIRNFYRYTIVFVCQFNRALSNIERIKLSVKGNYEMSPILEDFKDTGNVGQDCNTALGIFNPAKYNIQEYRKYEVAKMPESFRSVHIMKNRDGVDNGAIAMYFEGGVGKLRELPPVSDFEAGLADYRDYQ